MDGQGILPTYVVRFSTISDLEEEFDEFVDWAQSHTFPYGPFAFEFYPTPEVSHMVTFNRPSDVELWLYGYRLGWTMHKTSWLARTH